MSLFSTNRCKTLSAEYVEEWYKAVNETPDVSEPNDASVVNEAPDVSEADDLFIDEAIDALLESLNDEE